MDIENFKFGVFYGAMLLWMVWGLVSYFFNYAFQIYLGLLILFLMGWIYLTWWKIANVVVSGGSVRIINNKIP